MTPSTASRWSPPQVATLTELVWAAIAAGLRGNLYRHGQHPVSIGADPWLHQPAATFVTLHRHGELRGCIGTLEPVFPLGESVARNAQSAAFADPRFSALSLHELADIYAEISILPPMIPLAAASHAALLATLRPQIDGLVVRGAGRSATFLPVVWQDLSEPRQFVDQLWRKAGLPAGAWPADIALWTYAADKVDAGMALRPT